MGTLHFDYTEHLERLVPLLSELLAWDGQDKKRLLALQKKFPKADGSIFSKTQMIEAYKQLAGTHGLPDFDQRVVQRLQMKPVRTQSGVAPITVLTKPFPCPGKCIFCPSDVRMPKSYLSDEPGAQRAERNYFDPYLQTYTRLLALHSMGHKVDKAELIVLGGTWSFYPEPYQIWFIKECFRALNEFGLRDDRKVIEKHYLQLETTLSQAQYVALTNDPAQNKTKTAHLQIKGNKLEKKYNQVISEMYVAPEKKLGLDRYQSATWPELEKQQKLNELAGVRCVGLVLETRPDNISEQEVIRLRRLGATKTQIGVQSLQDEVLDKNHRGHTVAETRIAFALLRRAGFKIHAHWMANLHGSSVELDKQDFTQLFDDPDFKPDELKVYPCSLIESAELMQYYQRGEWRPYTETELLEVVAHALHTAPPYCRLTRVIRDIPSTDIVTGNKKTNFRQIAQEYLEKNGIVAQDIRAREIRKEKFVKEDISFSQVAYTTTVSDEVFLQFITKANDASEKLLAFLRLSIPKQASFIDDLEGAAIIREIHVYGPALSIGQQTGEAAQHLGLGKRLIQAAAMAARRKGFKKLAVISAIGTREYYRQRGFQDGDLYQVLSLE